ncbi:uncharacterized protein LOC141674068 [Apium graveolens]|uniref:uncharacterized protein LOC141674068 n=1 Tax=Apium graveolens TaxID=4045 RepID=UPI003D79CA70
MVLRDAHEGECGNHTNGRNLSLKILRLGYYRPMLRQDTLDYTKKCDAYQRHAPIIHQPFENLNMSIPPWPFMKWGMDIMGKMPPAPGNILYKSGVPSEIICDNGSQFISDKIEAFCKRWNINLIKSTPRYPQANGQDKSSNKIIINNLKKRLTSCKGKWAEDLPWVLWSDRKTPTGHMPYSLVYETEVVLPTEIIIPTIRYGLLRTDMNSTELAHDIEIVVELREMEKVRMVS